MVLLFTDRSRTNPQSRQVGKLLNLCHCAAENKRGLVPSCEIHSQTTQMAVWLPVLSPNMVFIRLRILSRVNAQGELSMTLLFLRLCLENKRALLRAFKGVHLVCLGPDPTEGDVSKGQGCICFHDLSKLCRPTLGGTQITVLSVPCAVQAIPT